jgi:serine/threonine protein kinase
LQPHTNDYAVELENLSLLKLLHHPNIVQLLGCYTYRGSHNFVFPVATGGDLSKLLKNERPEYFSDNSTFIVSLSGLASAISKVHNFVADEFQLELTGCHHDLKALNILVEKDRFILSDFGLARFKDTAQDSATAFKTRKGFTLAPECQDIDGSFEKHTVHRWSDIWSFGCIMLDVLTYMLRGSKGVIDFCNRRRFRVENNIYYYFHKGLTPNDGVTLWLEELEDMSSRAEKRLIQLIRKMLMINPASRPNALEVDIEMSTIALIALSEPILEQYGLLRGAFKTSEISMEPYIEERRFLSWMMSLGLNVGGICGSETPKTSVLDFRTLQPTIQILQTLRPELETILNDSNNVALRIFLPLRRLNSALLDILPPTSKAKAREIAELLILSTDNIEKLAAIQKKSYLQGGENRVSILAESKKLRLTAEEKTSTELRSWDLGKPIKELRNLGYHAIGLLQDDPATENSEVLIDYKSYEDPAIQQKLFGRMNEIVELCQSLKESEAIKVLHCRGYFHDESLAAFGLVYDCPSDFSLRTTGERINATTLHQILLDGLRSQRPLLTERFMLAKNLAGSISELHKIGWVHKGISSSNVAFFYESEATLLSGLQKPYIIGFRHSRPQESFTEGPTSDDCEMGYEHPDYSVTNQRFSLKYDYYSLGLVLLEIGLWKTLKHLGVPAGLSPDKVREYLLDVMVPRLGQSMGATYRDVVYTCLGDDLDEYKVIKDDIERKAAVQLRFEKEVLFKLITISQYQI